MRPPWSCVAVFLLLGSGGCAPPVSQGGFDAPDPASRLHAIARAVQEGDRSAVPRIVEQLDSADPVVRFAAIGALERLTGQTLGYAYDDPPLLRRSAVKRWVDWVESESASPDEQHG